MLDIGRSQVQHQTISNLVTAGVLKREEAEFYNKLLSAISWEDAMAALVESHQLRESSLNYRIGEICLN